MSATPLQWTRKGRLKEFRAKVENGEYVVSLYGRMWLTYAIFGAVHEIYCGESELDALAAAEAHHVTQTRAAAWERYMAENDPPEVGSAR